MATFTLRRDLKPINKRPCRQIPAIFPGCERGRATCPPLPPKHAASETPTDSPSSSCREVSGALVISFFSAKCWVRNTHRSRCHLYVRDERRRGLTPPAPPCPPPPTSSSAHFREWLWPHRHAPGAKTNKHWSDKQHMAGTFGNKQSNKAAHTHKHAHNRSISVTHEAPRSERSHLKVTRRTQTQHRREEENQHRISLELWIRQAAASRLAQPPLLHLCLSRSVFVSAYFLSVCLSLFLCWFLHFNPKPTPLLFPLSLSSSHLSLLLRPLYLFAHSFDHGALRVQDEKVLGDCCRSETGEGQKEGEMGRDGRWRATRLADGWDGKGE